jgi:aminopeptidase-like protein
MRWNYTRSMLAEALSTVGIGEGDIVFSHLAPPALGFTRELAEEGSVAPTILKAILDVIGPTGTILTPAFTYSFCSRQDFDPARTPCQVGAFGEWFRQQEGVLRSEDPLFSVAGMGPAAGELFHNLPKDCFGPGCLYDRLLARGAKVCNIGLDLFYFTPIHHMERMVGVPYRYDKLFSGHVNRDGQRKKETWIYSVRTNIPNSCPDLTTAQRKGLEKGIVRKADVGKGAVWSVELEQMFDHCRQLLNSDPWVLTVGPACDVLSEERARTGYADHGVHLPDNATCEEMVRGLWQLPRDLVSDGYDAAIEALSGQVPMTVHAIPTGTEAFTWIIPERWGCRKATLQRLDGEVLIDSSNHPLHCMSYSLPFSGEISRDELFRHLHTNPDVPDGVPFMFKYYDRDWGICCTEEQKSTLTDDRYLLNIDTHFSYGEMKIGEAVAAGRHKESIVLCAHLCHPGMVNDDLAGVAVGVAVIRELQKRDDLRYTYRLLLLPETVGSAGWLSRHKDLIPTLKGGIFLEMLATKYPHALQHSNTPSSRIDTISEMVMRRHDADSWASPFMTLPLNDERMFNSPGVNVPMVSLMRVLPMDARNAPYTEYHTSLDDPDHADFENLEKSKALVLDIIETLEADMVPIPLYQGELFVSRYSSLDYSSMFKLIMTIPYKLDGKRTISDIALQCGFEFREVKDFLDRLHSEGLLTYAEPAL